MACYVSANSQVLISLLFGEKLNAPGLEFGMEGGVNWTDNYGFENDNLLGKFNLGFYFDIRLKNQWNLHTGIVVKSSMGAEKLSQPDLDFLQANIYEEEGEYSQVFSYFLLPALIKYKFKNYLFIEAGTQAGLLRDSWVEFNRDEDDLNARIREFNMEHFNRMDVGISAGLGYTLLKGAGISIGLNYYYGLVNVMKDRTGSRNSSILLKFSLPVGNAKVEP
jgi:hypothetical protein